MENIFFHIRMLLGCLLQSSEVVWLELIVTKKKDRGLLSRVVVEGRWHKKTILIQTIKNITQGLILRSVLMTDPTEEQQSGSPLYFIGGCHPIKQTNKPTP